MQNLIDVIISRPRFFLIKKANAIKYLTEGRLNIWLGKAGLFMYLCFNNCSFERQ